MEARIFMSGNSQAVRIPRKYRLDAEVVEIFQRGDELILKPRPRNLGRAFELLASMPDDFMQEGRQDEEPQEREAF
ncbi:type II toxin-antitoxin system VapB family antitoxin [Marinospirillum sp.]|uniref:antitoxin n=1 Tax=Marinospirillum sp. TaxID=2183934 RepID=UPI002870B272|nr:type II toxin-antitoxin system VapB family antitoxin [Marinospirillum sp.]MDR9469470.1 type II toxin-antitoxin system VapB family antitoxin [Marinospirillum sp.]